MHIFGIHSRWSQVGVLDSQIAFFCIKATLTIRLKEGRFFNQLQDTWHVGMGGTTMRRYNGCGDNLSVLSPHAGPPCIAIVFLQKESSSAVSQMLDSKFLFCSLLSSFLVRAKNDVPLFNLPLWLSGLDTHQSWKHLGFNPRSSLEFFISFFFFFFFSVTYFILVLKRKIRNRRIEQERKKERRAIYE